jgi:hypothetical protein
MADSLLRAAPMLVLSRHTSRGLPSEPTFALLKLTPSNVHRLLALYRLSQQHHILWLTVDDVDVTWDAGDDPIEVTWLTLHRRRMTFEGHPFVMGSTVSSTKFHMDELESILDARPGVHFTYPTRWDADQARAYEMAVIDKLVQQGHLQDEAATKYRQGRWP